MPDYVYALHNFVPEKPDEVPFKVGDRIEVIERDELYQDGWWQGRNPQGEIGLFPQSYTSPNPPPPAGLPGSSSGPIQKTDSTSSESSVMVPIALDTLTEEPESSTTNATATPDHETRERTLSQGNGEVMQATMTDVQRAIEQLGRNDRDGTRSFSFVSSQGDYTDRSGTETEAESEDEGGLGWHKGAREKLAMRAKRENEERQAKEQAESGPSTPMRITAPPIDVEMSDDSEGEDDVEHLRRARESYTSGGIRHISEDDEEGGDEGEAPKAPAQQLKSPQYDRANHHIEPSEDFIVPLPDDSDLPTATATQATFPVAISSDIAKAPSPIPASPTVDTPPPQTLATPPASPAPIPAAVDPAPVASSSSTLSVTPIPAAVDPKPETPVFSQQAISQPIFSPASLKSMPSTIRIGQQLPFSSPPAGESPTASTIGSVGPSGSVHSTLTLATTVPSLNSATPVTSPAPQKQTSLPSSTKSAPKPTEWTVDDVVEWLKSKGIDQPTCDKFIEQEISGDVLLELNQDILKNEIGITAFGKRVRIMNFITELKRPPSPSESEKQAAAAASRAQSIKYSHSHTPSMGSSAQHSFHSGGPYYTGPQFSPVSSQLISSPSAPPGSAMGNTFLAAENSPHASEFGSHGWRASDPGSIHGAAVGEQQVRDHVGLGFGLQNSSSSPTVNLNGKAQKNRPSQLLLSPSDGALKASAIIDQRSPKRHEGRDVLSDSETAHNLDAKQKRRRLFGRSAESSSLNDKASSLKDNASRHSKDPSTPVSASASPNDPKSSVFEDETAPSRRQSRKRHSGERKASDRLSLFGSPFTSTIGKSRKPPPRLSTAVEDKPHLSTFSRIVGGGDRRAGRPSTSDGVRSKDKSKETSNERAILRKRTTSTAAETTKPVVTPVPVSTLGPNLERGKSILEQIGTPDHNGWMRKKSDRYNSWKTRYFVLKGPHLYVMKSNDKSETKIKGYINVTGYRVQADENIDPGRYGFQIIHDVDKTHYFSSDEIIVIREWMKAIMKATITRDYTNPVVSSSNIPTIPLTVAQAMNPAPRPPSPTAREATQRAHRRDNPNQLSTRDAEVLLMPMPGKEKSVNGHSERTRIDSFFTDDSTSTKGKDSTIKKSNSTSKTTPPPRPSREMRRLTTQNENESPDKALIEWANSHLPESLQVNDPTGPPFSGLALLRMAENIKGKPASPPVPDSAFPSHPDDEKLDGLFRLFDYLLDNDVKMGSVSINDIRQGKREKITQILRALRTWEEKRKAIAQSIGKGSVTSGPFMAPVDYF